MGDQQADDWTPVIMNALFSTPTQVPDYSQTPMGCL